MTGDRHLLRATFDQDAWLYDQVRPGYPIALIEDVIALSHLPPNGSILEIGCGTGQATLPFARRAYSILAVELGTNLAAVARQKLAAYPQAQVWGGAFEEWPVTEPVRGHSRAHRYSVRRTDTKRLFVAFVCRSQKDDQKNMLMLSARPTIDTWILQDNLSRFLDRVSTLIRFRFQEWDWDAIRFGVRDSDVEQTLWYEYELNGKPPVNLAFAHAGNGKRLCVRIETDDVMAVRLDAFARIMQCDEENAGTQDLEILIQAAFIDLPEPDQSKIVSCDAAHLAVCSECQDTLTFFTGKHWIDLLREGAWEAYGDASYWMLAAGAKRFFFPTYLIMAIRAKDQYLLGTVLDSVKKEPWTPLQEELIQYVLSPARRDEMIAC